MGSTIWNSSSWISIIAKFEILNKLLSLFDELMSGKTTEDGYSKKNCLFS